ncbi:MAG: oxidoreductase [Bacteroidia bacterium]
MNKTAIVFGATGLIGGFLVRRLAEDHRYAEIKVFTRKPLEWKHHKVDEIITDFKNLDGLRQQVKGDEVFCCLGTTINTAGSQAAFRKVDYELVRWVAAAAAENKIQSFLVVSSIGANANSSNFYLRTKGEMEKAVQAFGFSKCVIVRPSILLGPRKEFRLGESVGKFFAQLFSFLTPAKYKGIQAEQVAHAMIVLANDEKGQGIYENADLLKI